MGKRLFMALDLPAQVTQMLAGLDPQLAGLRWLAASQLHLTLGFVAAVAEEHEARLTAALAEICLPRFPLVLQGLGSFGKFRHPTVVWVGVANAPAALSRLQGQIHGALLAAGLKPDPKPFHAHITVGRCKGVDAVALRQFMERHAQDDFGTLEATGFTLYSSVLHPHGPEHLPVLQQAFDPA